VKISVSLLRTKVPINTVKAVRSGKRIINRLPDLTPLIMGCGTGSDPNGARITDIIGFHELTASHEISMFYAWI
jgi:hypothetical protein